jgi:hypothetical protein
MHNNAISINVLTDI